MSFTKDHGKALKDAIAPAPASHAQHAVMTAIVGAHRRKSLLGWLGLDMSRWCRTMMRERWCKNCRGWHRDGEWPRSCSEALYGPRSKPSELPLPFIRRDHMDAMVHPRTGLAYESRSDFEAQTKEYLSEHPNFVELGTEKATSDGFSDSDDIKSDVITAMKKVEQGYKPTTETAAASEGWVDP